MVVDELHDVIITNNKADELLKKLMRCLLENNIWPVNTQETIDFFIKALMKLWVDTLVLWIDIVSLCGYATQIIYHSHTLKTPHTDYLM